MLYSRETEQYMLDKLHEVLDDDGIILNILCYFSSDDTCKCLESICNDYEIELEERN